MAGSIASLSVFLTYPNFNHCGLCMMQGSMRDRDEKIVLFYLNHLLFFFPSLNYKSHQLLSFDCEFYFKIYFSMA